MPYLLMSRTVPSSAIPLDGLLQDNCYIQILRSVFAVDGRTIYTIICNVMH